MNINYDEDADCLYIQFQQGTVHKTKKMEDGILVDLDEDGKIFGIEIVGASERMPIASLGKIKVDLESDALYFRISEDAIEESEEVSKGLVVDYDASGKVVGIEVLNVKDKFKMEDLIGLKIEMPTIANVVA